MALFAHYEFDENTGTLASDSSGNGYDGTLLGATGWNTDTNDGSDSCLNVTPTVGAECKLPTMGITTGEITIACWFNSDNFHGSSDEQRLVSKASNSAANGHIWMLGFIQDGGLTVLRSRIGSSGVGTLTHIAAGAGVNTEQWHHAAVTYDTSDVKMYLDGTEVYSGAQTGGVYNAATFNTAIGTQPIGSGQTFNNIFDGRIDDVRIYDNALSASEVADLADAGGVPAIQVDAQSTVSTPSDVEITGTLSIDPQSTLSTPGDVTVSFDVVIDAASTVSTPGTVTIQSTTPDVEIDIDEQSTISTPSHIVLSSSLEIDNVEIQSVPGDVNVLSGIQVDSISTQSIPGDVVVTAVSLENTGLLAKADLVPGVDTVLYDVPSGLKAAVTLSLCNRGSDIARVNVAVSSSATPDNSEYIEYNTRVKNSIVRTGNLTNALKKIVVRSDTSNVNAVIYGVEEVDNG